MRTKRSLRLFREAWEGLKTLVEALARLGIIPLPPLLDTAGEETAGSKNGSRNGSKGVGGARGKGSGRRTQRTRGYVVGWDRLLLSGEQSRRNPGAWLAEASMGVEKIPAHGG